MGEIVYFETTVKTDQINVQISVASNCGNRWDIEENWFTEYSDIIQKISLKKDDDFGKSYYGDLEIRPITFSKIADDDEKTFLSHRTMFPINPYGCMIQKHTKGVSSRLEFKIYLEEYDYLKDYSYKFPLSGKYFGIKIVLSPILLLVDVPNFVNRNKVKRKRTKRDLIAGLKNLSADILSLLKEDTNECADVLLICGKKTVKAHRNVLAVRSSWFKNKFCDLEEFGNFTDFKGSGDFYKFEFESHRNEYCEELDASDAPIFDDILDFIYTGIYKPCDLEKTKYLYMAACKYGIHDLERKCVLAMKSLVVLETALDILSFSCYHENLVHLKFYILDSIFIKEKFDLMLMDEHFAWNNIIERHPYLRTEISINYGHTILFNTFRQILATSRTILLNPQPVLQLPEHPDVLMLPDSSNNAPLDAECDQPGTSNNISISVNEGKSNEIDV